MHTTHGLLDLAKEQIAVRQLQTLPMSDYRLAKLMGISESTMSNWRTGRSRIGTEYAKRFADATGLPVEYIYACIEHERAQSPEVKSILESIAQHFVSGSTAASILLALAVSNFAAQPVEGREYSHPQRADSNSGALYIIRSASQFSRRRRMFEFIRTLFGMCDETCFTVQL